MLEQHALPTGAYRKCSPPAVNRALACEYDGGHARAPPVTSLRGPRACKYRIICPRMSAYGSPYAPGRGSYASRRGCFRLRCAQLRCFAPVTRRPAQCAVELLAISAMRVVGALRRGLSLCQMRLLRRGVVVRRCHSNSLVIRAIELPEASIRVPTKLSCRSLRCGYQRW